MVNSGSSAQCDYYSVPEVNVSCALFVRRELSEGWQLCHSISFSSYLQEAAVGGEKLCLATAGSLFFIFWDLLNTCLFPLLKFLHVTSVDWISSNPSQNTGCCMITAP